MDSQSYWNQQHDKYAQADWIDKPTYFAQWAIQYFPAKGKLLELGAGQGQDSRFFAEKGYHVTASDFSDTALGVARQKHPSSINFQRIDLSKPLPFVDGVFDIVYAHLSLHYFDMPTTEKIFGEIRRVLKDGGVLAALFNSTGDPEIAEGRQVEPDFIDINGIKKRYFNPDSAFTFAKEFEVLAVDDKGTTYKDEAAGVHNLIRLIAKKPQLELKPGRMKRIRKST